LFSGDFNSGTFTNDTEGESIVATGSVDQSQGGSSKLSAPCSTLKYNGIEVYISASTNGGPYEFQGPVECSSSQGGGTAQSMTAGTTTQDSDGDGIPDSSDKCANNSNARCYREAA
jgi:hypothetical protein